MKTLYALALLLVLTLAAQAQSTSDAAVMLTATTTVTPPSITLHWKAMAGVTSYKIYRKEKDVAIWQPLLATLGPNDTAYTDNNVVPDSAYEYRVTRNATVKGDGYIYAGIELHATDYRGKLLLIIDSTFIDSLSSDITQLMNDISADGWAVESHYVGRNAKVTDIKAYIVNKYTAAPDEVKAVFLLGHVPVPYSGQLNPDAHPDHKGAWPADGYYGDMTGTYTDVSVNDTTAARKPLRNVPGDGKFDQSTFAGPVDLQVGRVDVYDMPAFAKTETALLKQYLRRDHDYRFKNFSTVQRGLINDNFGYFSGEAFASCGWRSFAPMFGDSNVHAKGYFNTLATENYLWSYGCGGGWYTGASGVGGTTDFAADTPKTVFTMLFGSYFGDWDSQDNFLRAPLATPGLSLTCCWAGRPYWYFHHMALGENIGYEARWAQNSGNYLPYYTSYGAKFVHIALMGDPTLRQHTITPASNVTFSTAVVNTIQLNWTATPETVAGYYVYRGTSQYGQYDRVSPYIISSTSFIDYPPASGRYYYYVKAVKWQNTPSGNYLNTSEGVGDSLSFVISGIADVAGDNHLLAYPNPANELTTLQWTNAPAGDYTVTVKDALGRTMFTTQVNISGKRYAQNISLKGYSAGCYLVEASSKAANFTQKLVVTK